MAIDPGFFIHESDKAALDTLKGIPGFTPFIRAFMKVWNEKQFRILNLSSRLKVSEKQLPGYYSRLKPICEKLGIEKIPELFIEQNPLPNAYTYGDNDPFIVLTSGMIETLPDELISSVLAHECGHIACHHTLYTTMGGLILSGAFFIPGLGSLITMPLQLAFAYWMRCSEFSADRAAVLCTGKDAMVETCMYLAGYNRCIHETASREQFIAQALEYREFIEQDSWNKTLESMILAGQRHPLTAIRAYEADRWGDSEEFERIRVYLEEEENQKNHTYIPTLFSDDQLVGRDADAVKGVLEEFGFTNIQMEAVQTPGKRIGQVTGITVNDEPGIQKYTWIKADSQIGVNYCQNFGSVRRDTGELQIQESSAYYQGKDVGDAYRDFSEHGFTDVIVVKEERNRPLFPRDGQVIRVTINGSDHFEKGDWVSKDSQIEIWYY